MSKKILTLLLVIACLIGIVGAFSSCGTRYTVTFDPNGGTLEGEATIQVKEGAKIPVPTVTKEGSILTGWYAGAKANTKWDFENDVVTADVTLKAWWTGGASAPQCEHNWEPHPTKEWIPVSCDVDGKEYYKCSICLFTKTETIKKPGHTLQTDIIEAGCATEGYTIKYCTAEGCTYPEQKYNIIQPTGKHIYDLDGDGFDDFTTVKQPTLYIPGKEIKVCKNCGAKNTFTVDPLGLSEDFKDFKIDNFEYTGGKYVNQPFVDVSASAGIGASSHHTICMATNMNDGSTDTYWSANTLIDGAEYEGDQIFMDFSKEFDIGIVSFILPFYSSWELGDNCYVSYDIEALVGGEWKKIGEIDDRNAVQNGDSGLVKLVLAEPVTTKSLRATVTHSSRYSPAMVYEIKAYAYVEDITRLASDMLSETTATISGKRNAYTDGASVLVDGRDDTGWVSNWRDVGYAYATLEFPGERYVAAVEFTIQQKAGREVDIEIWREDESKPEGGYWEKVKSCATTSDPVGTSKEGYQVIENSAGTALCAFAVEINDRTSKIRLNVTNCVEEWTFYVYDFVPYTIIEKATDLPGYTGCRHNALRLQSDSDVVAPTCETAGYSILTCASCGFKAKSDATHALGHNFGEYTITTVASGTAKGTKTATCANGCGATRTRTYTESYEEATITKFFKNAPAAWAHTYDDGNYIEACKWSIEQFKKYNFKATMNMAITFADSYVAEWQEMFSTGFFDLGSHSYNHSGIYNNKLNESSFLKDVDKAHYWFMARFKGQQILTFATPNGATSVHTSLYATYLMAAARNGGDPGYITDVEGLLTPVNWGNFNTYASKSGETEGAYVLVDKDGNTVWYKAVPVMESVTDPETGEITEVPTGEYTFEVTTTGGYEKESLDSYSEQGGDYILVHYISATGSFSGVNDPNLYKFIKKTDLEKNYVYIDKFGKLIDQNANQYDPAEPAPEAGQEDTRTPIPFDKKTGTYKYDPETYLFTWESTGSYDFDSTTRTYTFKADGSGKYTLAHVKLGSFEKVIDEVLEKEDLIVECIHSLEKETYQRGGMIHSSYVSTVSKFEYLKKQGLWVCSYTDVVQYLKEAQHAHVDTTSITDTEIKLTLTDDLEDYMFDQALTIKVDIPDDWTNVTVTQGGKAIELVTNEAYKDNMLVANCTIMDGYLYVDAVPDCGEIVITVAE